MNFVYAFIGKVWGVAFPIMLNYFIAKNYPASETADFFFYQAVALFISIFIVFGTNKHVVKVIGASNNRYDKHFKNSISAIFKVLVNGIYVTLVLVLISFFFLKNEDITIVLIWSIALAVQIFFSEYSRGFGRIGSSILYQLVISSLLVTCLLLVFEYSSVKYPSFLQLLALITLTALPVLILGIIDLSKYVNLKKAINPIDNMPIFGYKIIFPLLISNLTIFALMQSDLIILKITSTDYDMVSYGLAVKIAMICGAPILLLNSVVQHKFAALSAASKRAQANKLFSTTTSITFYTSILVFIFLIISVTIWGKWYWKEYYESSFNIFLVLCAAQLFNAYAGPSGVILIMTKKYTHFLKVTFIGAVCSIVATVLLSINYGAIGAAWGVLCGVAITNLLYLKEVRKSGYKPCRNISDLHFRSLMQYSREINSREAK